MRLFRFSVWSFYSRRGALNSKRKLRNRKFTHSPPYPPSVRTKPHAVRVSKCACAVSLFRRFVCGLPPRVRTSESMLRGAARTREVANEISEVNWRDG